MWNLKYGSRRWGGIDWEFGVNRCKLVYIGWINIKILPCSTGNYIQYPVINHNKSMKKEYIYNWITLLYSRNSHKIVSQLYFNKINLWKKFRASLMVQWLWMHLPIQWTWVWSLVQEDPTCCRATKPMHHNYWTPNALESVLYNKGSHWSHAMRSL